MNILCVLLISDCGCILSRFCVLGCCIEKTPNQLLVHGGDDYLDQNGDNVNINAEIKRTGLIKSWRPLALYITVEGKRERKRERELLLYCRSVEKNRSFIGFRRIFRFPNSTGNYVPTFKCIGHMDTAVHWFKFTGLHALDLDADSVLVFRRVG